MELPSKELILEVTGIEILSDYKIVVNNITYTSFKNDGVYITTLDNQLINIYELMHMMKVFAVEQGYDVDIYMTSGGYELELVGKCPNSDEYGCRLYGTNHIVESEAVTKACEWILTKKENNEE